MHARDYVESTILAGVGHRVSVDLDSDGAFADPSRFVPRDMIGYPGLLVPVDLQVMFHFGSTTIRMNSWKSSG